MTFKRIKWRHLIRLFAIILDIRWLLYLLLNAISIDDCLRIVD